MGHGFGKKSDVPKNHDQKSVMKSDGPQPQPFVGPVNQPGIFRFLLIPLQFGTGIAEKTAKGQNFQGHAAENLKFVVRVVQFIRQVSFDPGKRLALGAGAGNFKGDGRPSPT